MWIFMTGKTLHTNIFFMIEFSFSKISPKCTVLSWQAAHPNPRGVLWVGDMLPLIKTIHLIMKVRGSDCYTMFLEVFVKQNCSKDVTRKCFAHAVEPWWTSCSWWKSMFMVNYSSTAIMKNFNQANTKTSKIEEFNAWFKRSVNKSLNNFISKFKL